MIKRIKQAFANLNWSARENCMQYVDRSYRHIRDLPMTTKNTISVEEYDRLAERHDEIAKRALDTYGPVWKNYIESRTFNR